MVLKDIPASARPREKLLALGPAALADSELIALLLRTGFKGCSVLQLADNLLTEFKGLDGLLKATSGDLRRIKGLGPAKRAEIVAVMELARRSLKRELTQRPVFDSPTRVKDFLQMQLGGHEREVFAVMFLDAQHQLVLMEEMFSGTLTQTAVHPREIVKRAVEVNAAAVVLAHNHPSGVAEPSRADEHLTQTLIAALKLIDVKVLDHMVVGRSQVVSFAERGLL
ncbi:MAG: DNA repair protein RadC [Pseudorhodobacter sp.]|nr:DNA repair protein RadC [Rhizobacter sp.]